MLKRILSLFRRPTPEEAARDVLQQLLQHLSQIAPCNDATIGDENAGCVPPDQYLSHKAIVLR